MRKNLFVIAALLPFAAFARDAQLAEMSLSSIASPLSISTTGSSITYAFADVTFTGFNFRQLSGLISELGPVVGTLTSVSVDAVLTASTAFTYANDLTIYVKEGELATGGALQVGGFSNLLAAERFLWIDGDDDTPGTPIVETYTLLTPLTFTGAESDALIWLGNGYGAAGTSGTWSGSVTLNGIAPIPEPSTWALFALGGLGVAGFVARRRRQDAAAA